MPNPYKQSEFLSLQQEEIAAIVKEFGKPLSGVLIPDGTRKIGIICYGLEPSMKDFEKTLFTRINQDLMNVVKLFFVHGLQSLFVPCLTNGNLKRSKQYVDVAVNIGLKYILHSEDWMKFYNENGIRVKIYGNYRILETMGYKEVMDWIDAVQTETSGNNSHTLYYGIACSNREEYARIMNHAVAFHQEHGRTPTHDELVEWYYNGNVNEIDFFIRPTIFRDSDVQPPLISGVNTQMYFPAAPFPFINQEMIREIFFDLIYNRTITYGTDGEAFDVINDDDLESIKNYYTENRSSILGVGDRIGDFWLPTIRFDKPKRNSKNQNE
jgi:undecaprenyl diphosphate synthase